MAVLFFQRSFFARLTEDKNSENFFKVFSDRMKEAQTEIKATVTVSAGDSLSEAKKQEEGKEGQPKEDGRKPCKSSMSLTIIDLESNSLWRNTLL